MTEHLAYAIAAFTLAKLAFSFLGWYSQAGEDKIYRKHLDSLFDRLHELTLFELAHGLLVRLVRRVRETFGSGWKAIGVFLLVCLVLNAISLVVCDFILVVIAGAPEVFTDPEYYWGDNNLTPFMILFGAILIGLILCDLVSSVTTWLLLIHVIKVNSIGRIAIHFVVDILVVSVAFFFSWLLFMGSNPHMIIAVAGHMEWENRGFPPLSFVSEAMPYIIRMISESLSFASYENSELRYLFIGLILTLTSALPTVCYLFITSALLMAYLLPHRILIKAIYLVTTDSKPVLSQLGNAVGGLAAVLAVVLAVLK